MSPSLVGSSESRDFVWGTPLSCFGSGLRSTLDAVSETSDRSGSRFGAQDELGGILTPLFVHGDVASSAATSESGLPLRISLRLSISLSRKSLFDAKFSSLPCGARAWSSSLLANSLSSSATTLLALLCEDCNLGCSTSRPISSLGLFLLFLLWPLVLSRSEIVDLVNTPSPSSTTKSEPCLLTTSTECTSS